MCLHSGQLLLNKKNKLHVVNACWRNGWPAVARGKAWSISKNNHRLKTQFFWPFTGSYWILYVDPHYQYAVVGNQARSKLWILARQPIIDKMILDKLIQLAADHGVTSHNNLEKPSQPILREMVSNS